MCTQKPPHDYSQQLYEKYRESFEEYITSTVEQVTSSSFFLLLITLHVNAFEYILNHQKSLLIYYIYN